MGPLTAPPGNPPASLAFMEQETKRLPDVDDSKRGLAETGVEKRGSAPPRALPAVAGRTARGNLDSILRPGAEELEHRHELKKARPSAGRAALGDEIGSGRRPAVPGSR